MNCLASNSKVKQQPGKDACVHRAAVNGIINTGLFAQRRRVKFHEDLSAHNKLADRTVHSDIEAQSRHIDHLRRRTVSSDYPYTYTSDPVNSYINKDGKDAKSNRLSDVARPNKGDGNFAVLKESKKQQSQPSKVRNWLRRRSSEKKSQPPSSDSSSNNVKTKASKPLSGNRKIVKSESVNDKISSNNHNSARNQIFQPYDYLDALKAHNITGMNNRVSNMAAEPSSGVVPQYSYPSQPISNGLFEPHGNMNTAVANNKHHNRNYLDYGTSRSSSATPTPQSDSINNLQTHPTGSYRYLPHSGRMPTYASFHGQPSQRTVDNLHFSSATALPHSRSLGDNGSMQNAAFGPRPESATASQPLVRGGVVRSSMPIIRSQSSNFNKYSGIIFLVYGEETKRALLPNEITSLDTVRALFVRSFAGKLDMAFLESPKRKIYILDPNTKIYYQLEDLRDITNQTVLRVHECNSSDPQRVKEPIEVRGQTIQTSTNSQDLGSRQPLRCQSAVPYEMLHPPPKPEHTRSITPTNLYYQSNACPRDNYDLARSRPLSPTSYNDHMTTIPENRSSQGSLAVNNVGQRIDRGSHVPAKHLTRDPVTHADGRQSAPLPGIVSDVPLPANHYGMTHSYRVIPQYRGREYVASDSLPPRPQSCDPETRFRMDKMEQQLANLAAWVHTDMEIARERAEISPSSTNTVTPRHSPQPTFAHQSVNSRSATRLATLKQQASSLSFELKSLRHLHLENMNNMKHMVSDTSRKIKNMLSLIVINSLSANDRITMEAMYQNYILTGEETWKILDDLECTMDEVGQDVTQRQCHVTSADIEAFALSLSEVARKLAGMKNQFPHLKEKMKEVMSREMTAVVKEEKFLKEEPQRVEIGLRRCKKLKSTLYTLKRLAVMQEDRTTRRPNVPISIGTPRPVQKQAVFENIQAMIPDHDARMMSIQAADSSRERKRKLINGQEIKLFERALQMKAKSLRPTVTVESKGLSEGLPENVATNSQKLNIENRTGVKIYLPLTKRTEHLAHVGKVSSSRSSEELKAKSGVARETSAGESHKSDDTLVAPHERRDVMKYSMPQSSEPLTDINDNKPDLIKTNAYVDKYDRYSDKSDNSRHESGSSGCRKIPPPPPPRKGSQRSGDHAYVISPIHGDRPVNANAHLNDANYDDPYLAIADGQFPATSTPLATGQSPHTNATDVNGQAGDYRNLNAELAPSKLVVKNGPVLRIPADSNGQSVQILADNTQGSHRERVGLKLVESNKNTNKTKQDDNAPIGFPQRQSESFRYRVHPNVSLGSTVTGINGEHGQKFIQNSIASNALLYKNNNKDDNVKQEQKTDFLNKNTRDLPISNHKESQNSARTNEFGDNHGKKNVSVSTEGRQLMSHVHAINKVENMHPVKNKTDSHAPKPQLSSANGTQTPTDDGRTRLKHKYELSTEVVWMRNYGPLDAVGKQTIDSKLYKTIQVADDDANKSGKKPPQMEKLKGKKLPPPLPQRKGSHLTKGIEPQTASMNV